MGECGWLRWMWDFCCDDLVVSVVKRLVLNYEVLRWTGVGWLWTVMWIPCPVRVLVYNISNLVLLYLLTVSFVTLQSRPCSKKLFHNFT